MSFDIAFALSLIPDILRGAVVTLEAAVLGCAGAAVLGLFLAILQRIGRYPRLICIVFVDIIRSSPFLVQLYCLYFALPAYGVTLPATTVAILALVIHFGSYLCEVFGAGIDAVPAGQGEAGAVLGLRDWQIRRLIVFPQALRMIAPPMFGYFISLFKTTPYLAVVGVPDMLGVAFDRASSTFRYVEPLTVVGIAFLLLCSMIGLAGNWVAQRIAQNSRGLNVMSA